MTKSRPTTRALLGALAVAGVLAVAPTDGSQPAMALHGPNHGAQGAAGPTGAPATPAKGGKGGVGIGADELHRAGGVPPGWRFAWPDGDARKGREAFAKLECYQCHEVKGESFPPVAPDPTRRGPALTGMGDHHPAEYFAESILNPNAVIVTGSGHTGPDGLSIMPDFRDSLTLAEAIDLVAYIRSLTGGDHDQAHHPAEAPAEREQVVGDYRVRLTYAAGGGDHAHQHHGRPQHQHGQPQSGAGGAPIAHLMVFITDAKRGEPLPYLPVSARIHADGAAPRTLKLAPILGGNGFYYGADITLPATTQKITVAIGKPTLKLMPAVSGRFARDAEVSFEWGK